jgi:hypothetical protein
MGLMDQPAAETAAMTRTQGPGTGGLAETCG